MSDQTQTDRGQMDKMLDSGALSKRTDSGLSDSSERLSTSVRQYSCCDA